MFGSVITRGRWCSRKAVAHGGSTVVTTASRVCGTSQVHEFFCPSYSSAGVVIEKPEKSYSILSTAHTEPISVISQLTGKSNKHESVSYTLYRSDYRSPVKGDNNPEFSLNFRDPGW